MRMRFMIIKDDDDGFSSLRVIECVCVYVVLIVCVCICVARSELMA